METESLLQALLLATLAGAGIPLGGLLGRIEDLLPGWLEGEVRHSVLAFGAGLLVAAAALVLVPEGDRRLDAPAAAAALFAGGVCFAVLDMRLSRSGATLAMLLAMLLDFVPEALAMGALFRTGETVGPLLAVLIFAQNVPEAFNAQRELRHRGLGGRREFAVLVGLALLGPLAAFAGAVLLHDPVPLGATMLFAAGGILYLLFQDIAPQVPLAARWGPPLSALAGFLVADLARRLTGG